MKNEQTSLKDFVKKFDWHNYNESQTQEKILFMQLLRELCDLLIEQPLHRIGRKPVSYSDMIYALALKSYLTFSSRRVCSDLKLAAEVRDIEKPFHFNTLLKYLDSTELRSNIIKLIEISALPLRQIEQDFAVDATGFGISIFSRWSDVRANRTNVRRLYRKCHCVYGVYSNIVTSVEVTRGCVHDNNLFEPLIRQTADNWNIREVSADKGYLCKANLKLVSDIGAMPFIPFKSNIKSRRSPQIWKDMFSYFHKHREEFLLHYHKRSNAEAGFSMIKRRFGNNVRCKKEISQDNEILLKVLCHNICVLVQELFLSGILVNFRKCADTYVAHKCS